MGLKLVPAVVAAAMALLLLFSTAALASVRMGDDCTAVGGAPSFSATQLAVASSSLPQTAPAGGVITSWGYNASVPELESGPGYTMKLKVLRSTSDPNTFSVVGESAREAARDGSHSFPARIPVQAGDRLGTGGGNTSAVLLYCESPNPSDSLGIAEGDPGIGSSATFTPTANLRLAVFASIEPDIDNDGYGDETQDQCPQSAAFQVTCPPVALSTSKQVRKGSVTIIVTTSTAAPVTVKGVAKLGKGKKAALNGGTQNLTPGVLGKFTLKFSKKLKTKLKELSPKRKLTLKVTVSGTSVAGAVTTNTLKVKLKGQAKD